MTRDQDVRTHIKKGVWRRIIPLYFIAVNYITTKDRHPTYSITNTL